MFISKPLLCWLFLSAIIVIYDASYILNRPHTLKGGSLAWLFQPYQIYLKYDTLYGKNKDVFVVLQSWMNLIEAALLLLTVSISVFSKSNCMKLFGGHLAVIVSTMVFWKTVAYICYSYPGASAAVRQFTFNGILYYWVPSLTWVVIPFLVVISTTRKLIAAKYQKEKQD